MSEVEIYHRFFEVKLELFDGPIDLLLHLVKKRELPIEKVSLAEVTGQYLECIKGLRYYDVEVAAEYLVIAATLLAVKASVILNEPVELVVDDEGDLVDPHEQLLERLKQLEEFRALAQDLGARPVLGHDVFAPRAKTIVVDPKLIPLADHQSELLARALQAVLSRLGEKAAVFAITVDSVSVVERMRIVVDSLKERGGASTFWGLLGERPSRASTIGIFIALLELCRRRMVGVSQSAVKGEIAIALLEGGTGGADPTKPPVEEELVEVAA